MLHELIINDKFTYIVFSAARHDVFEFDFWHIVGSWQVKDKLSSAKQAIKQPPYPCHECYCSQLTKHENTQYPIGGTKFYIEKLENFVLLPVSVRQTVGYRNVTDVSTQ